MTGASRSPEPPRSPSPWAEPHDDSDDGQPERARTGDRGPSSSPREPAEPDAQPERARTGDHDPGSGPRSAAAASEFTQIFGDPASVRVFGDAAVEHRRRGMATAAGGGDTFDRRRKGSSDDVLVTLLAHPAATADQAVHGDALRASRRLRVDVAGRRSERRDLVFDASLRTVLWWRRPARLRLYGSASMNVTILTLTPAVARRRSSRWFVRPGYRAMERILEQLEAEVEPLRWQPRTDA